MKATQRFSKMYVLAALAVSFTCRAQKMEETNIIARGRWSEPVSCGVAGEGAMRGRLMMCYGYSAQYSGDHPETLVFLELQNVSGASTPPLEIYCDLRNGLRSELQNEQGNAVSPNGGPGSGTYPEASWITLPCDATLRLRASWYGYGFPRGDGLLIPLFTKYAIRAGDTNSYYLSSVFDVKPPTNHVCPSDHLMWQGKLVLPKIRLSATQSDSSVDH